MARIALTRADNLFYTFFLWFGFAVELCAIASTIGRCHWRGLRQGRWETRPNRVSAISENSEMSSKWWGKLNKSRVSTKSAAATRIQLSKSFPKNATNRQRPAGSGIIYSNNSDYAWFDSELIVPALTNRSMLVFNHEPPGFEYLILIGHTFFA